MKIHYDTGKYSRPESRRYTICICDFWTSDEKRTTQDHDKINCKKCLRKLGYSRLEIDELLEKRIADEKN